MGLSFQRSLHPYSGWPLRGLGASSLSGVDISEEKCTENSEHQAYKPSTLSPPSENLGQFFFFFFPLLTLV